MNKIYSIILSGHSGLFVLKDLGTGKTSTLQYEQIKTLAVTRDTIYLYSEKEVADLLINNNIFNDKFVNIYIMYQILFFKTNNLKASIIECNNRVKFMPDDESRFYKIMLGFYHKYNKIVGHRCRANYLLYKYINNHNTVYIQNTEAVKKVQKMYASSIEFSAKDKSLFTKLNKITNLPEGETRLEYNYGKSAGGRYGSPIAHSLPRNRSHIAEVDINKSLKVDHITRDIALSVSRACIGLRGGYVHSIDLKGADFEAIKSISRLDEDYNYTTFLPEELQTLPRLVRKTIILATFFGITPYGTVNRFPEEDKEVMEKLHSHCRYRYKSAIDITDKLRDGIIKTIEKNINTISFYDIPEDPKFEIQIDTVANFKEIGKFHCSYKITNIIENKVICEILLRNIYVRLGKICVDYSKDGEPSIRDIRGGNIRSHITQNMTQRKMESLIAILKANNILRDFMFIHDEIIFSSTQTEAEIRLILDKANIDGYTIRTGESMLELGCS